MKPHEKLGIAIADAGYKWTPEMRSAWEELDKEVVKRENEWRTTSNYSQLVLRTNEELMNEVQELRKIKINEKPYGYVMKFESGIEAFNTEEYELPDDKRISSIPLYTHPVKELTPCEELRAFQEQQNGVFSDHNACCYRHECRIVWNDWEKLRSNPVELTDEEIWDEVSDHLKSRIEPKHLKQFARAILRKAQEK